MALDKVMKRAVSCLIGAEESIAAIAGVDQVMFALCVSSVRQRVAPDTVAEAYEIAAWRLRWQQVFRVLPRDEACSQHKNKQCWGVFIYYLYLNIKLDKKVFELSI